MGLFQIVETMSFTPEVSSFIKTLGPTFYQYVTEDEDTGNQSWWLMVSNKLKGGFQMRCSQGCMWCLCKENTKILLTDDGDDSNKEVEDSGIDVNLGPKLPGELLLNEHVSEGEDQESNYSESEESSNHHQSSIASDQENLERLAYQAEDMEGGKSKI